MQTSFKSLKKTIEALIGDIGEREEARLYQRYYRLLQHSLPDNWRHHVLLLSIHDGCWWLGVKSRQDAYLLRFLLPEIHSRLSQHLPNPPQLRIKADPEYWSMRHREQIPTVRIDQRHYSDEEVDAILTGFIAKLRHK